MAAQHQANQSTLEEKIYPLDYAPSLLEGVELVSIDITYEGANDVDDLPEYGTIVIDGSVAYVNVSNLVIGQHRFRCIGRTDNDDLSPEIMLMIEVKY